MIQKFVTSTPKRGSRLLRNPIVVVSALLVSFGPDSIAQATSGATSSAADPPARATHILGLDDVSKGANGRLSVQDGALQFQGAEGRRAHVSVASIQDVFSGEQDRQVGGVPMTLGQAATPFGGGRVIALFSHKKFETLTVQYLDTNGGLHGAIFQLNKAQAEVLQKKLRAEGAQVARTLRVQQ
jgi:hypothetical protein